MFRMIFDAQKTTKMDWFSGKWLTSHPFRDLGVEPLDIFSPEGYALQYLDN